MEFLTKVDIKPLKRGISHQNRILTLGSCFADNIARKLSKNKFRVTGSPTGVLFNPESIAGAIERFLSGQREVAPSELFCSAGVWSHYDFHSAFSACEAEGALQKMEHALQCGVKALKEAEVVIITFGTAWVYRLAENGKVVANCHKQPQRLFQRELLSVEQITGRYTELLNGKLRDKQVIFTLSPVRHLGDGLEGNSLSKATLRVAIEQIIKSCENAEYFPSYEIQLDELRDYRFYAEDMTHPSAQAVDYIWERFSQVAFSEKQMELMEQISSIVSASEHRPFNPQSQSHKVFCQNMMCKIEKLSKQLPFADFTEEIETFKRYL